MFNDPAQTVAQSDLQSGWRVADLGAGSGALSLAAARAVGEAGKVYAVEVQKDLLERLQKEARAARIHNIEVLWGDIERLEGTHLKSGSLDAAIASRVIFQLEDGDGFAEETKRILRVGGRLFVIDPADPTALLTRHHFSVIKRLEVGKGQYGIIFKKI